MEDLGKLIFTGVVSLLVGFVLQRLRPQVKLRFWTPHSFYFNLEKEQLELRTDSLTVQNLGRKSASSVEIIYRQRPDFFQIFPSIQYEEDQTPRGEHIIRLASLGSKEHVYLQLLNYCVAPELLSVRCIESPAKPMQIQIQPFVPKWVAALLVVLMATGAGFLLYWLIEAIWFSSKGVGGS
jgi:hypothetical protein